MVIGVLHNMKVKCELLCQKNKRDPLLEKNVFFLMQEVTLHFLFDASHRHAV